MDKHRIFGISGSVTYFSLFCDFYMNQNWVVFSKMIILGFLTILWLGPKDTELRATSVPKAKLGHSNCVRHQVILPLVMVILGFLIIPWLGPKDTEPCETSVPKAKLGHTEVRAPSVPKAKLGQFISVPM